MPEIDLWGLPGPAAWLDGVIAERNEGRSGVIVCPCPGEPRGLLDALIDSVPRGMSHFEPDLVLDTSTSAAAVVTAAARLADALGLASRSDPGELARDPDLGRATISIDARGQECASVAAWAGFAAAFSAGGRSLPRSTRPTVWVLLSPGESGSVNLPPSDVTFAHRWWWGVMSPLDALVAAHRRGLEPDLGASVAELARWDLGLVDELTSWDGDVRNLDRYMHDPVTQGRVDLPPSGQAGGAPGAEIVGWSAGLVQSWEGTVSAHVHLEIRSRPEAARLRVWAAQVARAMPFIELERDRLGEWLAGVIDASGGAHGSFVGADIASLEIGQLWRCVGEHGHIPLPRERIALLRDLKDLRNAVAHRSAVSHSTLAELRRRAIADRPA